MNSAKGIINIVEKHGKTVTVAFDNATVTGTETSAKNLIDDRIASAGMDMAITFPDGTANYTGFKIQPSVGTFIPSGVNPPSTDCQLSIAAVSAMIPVKKQGANLSYPTYWDPGNFNKNLFWMNPSMEPVWRRPFIVVVRGTATSFSDGMGSGGSSAPWGKNPDDYFKNFSALIRSSDTNLDGLQRTIAHSKTDNTGTTYIFDQALPKALSGSDRVYLQGEAPSVLGVVPGWWQSTKGVSVVKGDVAPSSKGYAAALVQASNYLAADVDTTVGRTFITLSGSYTGKVWAKAKTPGAKLTISMQRTDQSAVFSKQFALTDQWELYTANGVVNEARGTIGPIRAKIQADGGDALVDDTWFGATADITNPLFVRNPVVVAHKALNLQTLRCWQDMGRGIEEWLIPNDYRCPHSPGVFSIRDNGGNSDADDTFVKTTSLFEQIKYAWALGTKQLYINTEVGWDKYEIDILIRALFAPKTDKYGTMREVSGLPPVNTLFDEVLIELANEPWNNRQAAGCNPYVTGTNNWPYADYVNRIAPFMKSHIYWPSTRNVFIAAGIQRNDTWWPVQTKMKDNPALDGFTIAHYMQEGINDYATAQQLFQPWYSQAWEHYNYDKDYCFQQLKTIQSWGKKIWIYEWGINTTAGALAPSYAAFSASMGAAVATAIQMLQSQFNGLQDMNIFCWPQYSMGGFKNSSGQDVNTAMWGLTVDVDGQYRVDRVPLYALKMLNSACQLGKGAIAHVTGTPVYSQGPNNNGSSDYDPNYVKFSTPTCVNIPVIQAASFADGHGNYAVFIINTDFTNTHGIEITGATPQGQVTVTTLANVDAMANNEQGAKVIPVVSYTQGTKFTLPANSVTLLQFQV